MVKASKIISGQEPMKTNELLQAIGKAIDKKVIHLFFQNRISFQKNRLITYYFMLGQ